jgi:hypothetical protein
LIGTSDNNSLGALVVVVLYMLDDTYIYGVDSKGGHPNPYVPDAKPISKRAIVVK